METLIGIQHWLYSGIGEGLGSVANGDDWAVMAAMAAAILFGAVHALMPGHGKIVLISYHLGQPSSPTAAFTNGAILILALAHVGLAVALVLAGYAVISRAFAYGGRTPQFEAASGVLIIIIGAYLLWASLTHRHNAVPNGRSLALASGTSQERRGRRLRALASVALGYRLVGAKAKLDSLRAVSEANFL